MQSKHLNVKELIIEAYKLCRDNLKTFYTVSLLFILINGVNISLFELYSESLVGEANWWIGVLIKVAVLFVSVWATLRLSVAAYFIFNDAHHGSITGIGQAFGRAKGYTVSLFMAHFGLFLILAIPSGLMTWVYKADFTLSSRLFLFTVALGVNLFLATKFGLAPINAVLDSNSEGAFERSAMMTKSVILPAMVIITLADIMTPISFVINEYSRLVDLTSTMQYGLSGLRTLLSFLIIPFQTALLVKLYNQLKTEDPVAKDLIEVDL